MSIAWKPRITLDKDPDSILDYSLDWSDWLSAGDTVSAVSVTADTGITVDSSSVSGDSTVVWLSGGTAGTTYEINVHMTTADTREVDRTFRIRVKER